MRRSIAGSFAVATAVFGIVSLTAACSGGEIAVGKTDQELKVKKDGGATGNGQTCSWEGTAAYDVATGTTTTTPGASYGLGDTFKSPDGCNDCSCSTKGIMCTMRACDPNGGGGTSPGNPGNGGGQACTEEAKQCPDGSYVGRTGPNCEFAPCPGGNGGTACTAEAKQCPDGTSVGRTGPNCEFAPCPGGTGNACPADAKQCPDGTYVGRSGPNCDFAPCPK